MSRQGQPMDPPPMEATGQPDAIETFVPYKNSMALAAYYCGVFSILPLIGIPLGITAFVLGLKGRKAAVLNPQVRGKAHAWVGIIMGGICGFGQLAAILFAALMIVLKG